MAPSMMSLMVAPRSSPADSVTESAMSFINSSLPASTMATVAKISITSGKMDSTEK